MTTSAPSPLVSPRLTLRALRASDASELLWLYQSNRTRFSDSFPQSVASLRDEDAARIYIESKATEWEAGRGFWYCILSRFNPAEPKLIGQVQIKNVDWELSRAEIAYLLDQEFEGRGLMSEALGLVLEACFDSLGLNRVFLRTIVGNDRSSKLAERLGFIKEGTLREEFLTLDKKRVDLNYFGMLSSEFNKRSARRLPRPASDAP
jgi:RimJ/RimL family protein N-acetyltransferase